VRPSRILLLTLLATLLVAAPAHAIRHGTRRTHVDPTVAHRNHIHIGLTKAGAARRTSFWSAAR
jgi:hypothetical protein